MRVGAVLNNMGNSLLALRRHAEARVAFERAIALKTKALGPSSPSLVPSLAGIAEVDLATGQPARALAALERARALAKDGDPATREKLEALLARARARSKH